MRVDLRNVHRPSAADVTTGSAGLGTVGEPSVAIVEDQVLLTGNWYAARSIATTELTSASTIVRNTTSGFASKSAAVAITIPAKPAVGTCCGRT